MPKDFDIPKMMENGEFEPLLPNNKRQDVKISGEYNFSNSALSNTRNITLKKEADQFQFLIKETRYQFLKRSLRH
ncbi:hypothetical protein MOP91_16080 [Enterococcus faecium]|nr:hypothetical protein [Enterococcus faecium]